MKRIFYSLLLVGSVFLSTDISAQLLFSEPFNYTPSATNGLSSLSTGQWALLNTGDSILVTSGNLGYPGVLASSGNKIAFAGGGADAAKTFTQQTTGTVYYSFLLNVTALGSLNTTGGYFTAFNEGTGTNYGGTVWVKLDGSGYDIGINPRTTAANTIWSTGNPINTPLLVVVAYQLVSGSANDIVKMWINPTLGGTEPSPSFSATNTGTDLANLNRILLRQDATATTPFIEMDEFRVGTTWASVTPTFPSASTDYFRSKKNGNWNSIFTWETSADSANWISSTMTPDQNAAHVVVNDVVTATANFSVSRGTIADVGDSLYVQPGVSMIIGGSKIVTVNTGAGLILQSSSAGIARIGTSTGSVNGNVTVQRYIAGGRRAYRFLAHPFSNATALSQYSDEVDVTGAGGTANGFTNDVNVAPSSFYYDVATGVYVNSTTSDPGWKPFTSTAQTIASGDGFRLFIRGSKGQANIFTSPYDTPNSTTISVNGTLNPSGDYVKNIAVGASSGYNMIGNPYVSAVNIKGLTLGANVNNGYSVWNSLQGTAGGYTTQQFGTDDYSLPICGSFFVQATAASTITFKEADKVAAESPLMLRAINSRGYVKFSVLGDNVFWDAYTLRFDKNANASKDVLLDADKLHNSDVNLYSLTTDNKALAIDVRPYTENAIIPIGFTSKGARTYTLKVNSFSLDINQTLYLIDKYLGTETKLEQGSTYEFAVNSNSASQGENRFELVAKKSTISIQEPFTVKLVPNPTVDNAIITINNSKTVNTVINIANINGVIVKTINAGKMQNGRINVDMKTFTKGTYFVTIVAGNEKNTQKLQVQ